VSSGPLPAGMLLIRARWGIRTAGDSDGNPSAWDGTMQLKLAWSGPACQYVYVHVCVCVCTDTLCTHVYTIHNKPHIHATHTLYLEQLCFPSHASGAGNHKTK
jgi:hypothetical protein